MKRLIAAVLLLVLLLSMAGTVFAQNDDFTAFLEEVNEERAANMKKSAKIASYAKPYQDTITVEEAALLARRRGYVDKLTREQALEDVDVYFRLLKTSYGPYYYFGGDARFDKAQAQVEQAIGTRPSIKTEDLKKALLNALYFINDGHFSIGNTRTAAFVRYNYYYCEEYFQQDDQGFYKTVKDEKWYVAGQTNAAVKIEPTLKKNGEIVYSPVLHSPYKAGKSDYVVLKNAAGEEMSIKLRWKAATNYNKQPMREPKVEYTEKSGVPYVAVRCFPGADKTPGQAKELNSFTATGRSLKGKKVFIMDLRSNGGGSDEYIREWLKNYAGKQATYPEANISRGSRALQALDKHVRSGWSKFERRGSVIKNKSLILVLMDSNCGSSGESALNTMRCMENVVVVGSQSGGWQLGGNGRNYFLPNSALPVCVPQALNLFYDGKNVDGKGYAPDLWCNPSTSLTAVLNMIELYGLND